MRSEHNRNLGRLTSNVLAEMDRSTLRRLSAGLNMIRRLPGAASEAQLLSKSVPFPDSVGDVFGKTVAKLASECDYLTSMMGFMSEHVGEHRRPSRP
jgi:hypothetical protein